MSIQRVDKTTGDTSLLAGSTLWAEMPIGTVIGSFLETAPSGFLYCDDTAYRASDYPELWAILPSTVKDTVNNTFTIDLRESTLKGTGLTSKSNNHYDSDGVALGEFIDDRIQDHEHNLAYQSSSGGSNTTLKSEANNYSMTTSGSVSSSYRIGATTEVKSTGVRWYIKAVQVALPADLEAQVEEAVDNKLGWTLLKSQNVEASDTVTFTLPANYNEVLIIAGTPVFRFSDIIPFDEMENASNYALYHETSISGGNATQVFDFTLAVKGRITVTTIKQNGSTNTGNIKIYYR